MKYKTQMSCLFNSLSRELQYKNIYSISSYELRQEACNYLHHDFPIISGMSTHELLNITHGNYSKYISNMRRDNTWGGAIEIQAICNIFKVRVIVVNIRNRFRNGREIEFLPVHENYSNTLKITWSGGHYEPMLNN